MKNFKTVTAIALSCALLSGAAHNLANAQDDPETVTGPAFIIEEREPTEAAEEANTDANTAYDETDYETAASLFEDACEGGHMRACRDRGYMAEAGIGMDQDYADARAFYQLSCNGGDASGCAYLGEVFHKGWGVSEDYPRALELYTQACDNGSAYGLSLIHI